MKRKQMGTMLMVGLMMAGLAGIADAGREVRRARHTERMTPEAKAIAALTPVDAAAGWGRVKVEEQVQADGTLEREVTAELYSLEPSSDYWVIVDDVVLGQVTTDVDGWAVLKLESPGDEYPPVPDGLPSVADLVSAVVTDASDAFVLEGAFVQVGDPWDDGDGMEYEEKIVLEDVTGMGVAGIAKVEAEGMKQEFETRASGLVPGDSYNIFVDAFLAGVVTADPVGQARLSLEYPDDENPLPPEMMPVQDLRLVEWTDVSGEILLSGTFTGTPGDDDGHGDHDEYRGEIVALAADGFTLSTAMDTYQVVVTAATVFEDFTDLSELQVGDMVEVKGTLEGDTITARKIELKGYDDDGDDDHGDGMDSYEGQITALAADGFTLANGMGTWQVVVTAATVFENFSDLSELQVGDMVEVDGTLDGDTITAAKIELKGYDDDGDDDHGDGMDSYDGQITALAADGFTLAGGMGTWEIVVDAATVFEDVSGLDGLNVGDRVEVEGSLQADGTVLASKVELKDHH